MGSSDRRVARGIKHQVSLVPAIPVARLPYPSAPLQGVTAGPSRNVLCRGDFPHGSCAGQFPIGRSRGVLRARLPSSLPRRVFGFPRRPYALGFERNVMSERPHSGSVTEQLVTSQPAHQAFSAASTWRNPAFTGRLRADTHKLCRAIRHPRVVWTRHDSQLRFGRHLGVVVCPPGYSLRRLVSGFPLSPRLWARCASPASHRSDCWARRATGQKTAFSPGVRVPFGVQTRAIVELVCLTSSLRSQGFTPSQRFDPARALWPCFMPHPPLGFRPSRLFPPG